MLYKGYVQEERSLISIFNQKNRRNDPFEESEQLERFVAEAENAGRTRMEALEAVAATFEMDIATLYNKLNLLRLDRSVRTAVENGRITVTSGYELGREAAHIQQEVVRQALQDRPRASVSTVKAILRAHIRHA